MSRIPASAARRIDALALRAHAFHRLAHHPLCLPYAGEVIRIGRRARICRGCALLGAGALAGAVVALALRSPPGPALAAAAGALALLALPAAARRGPRLPKAATRLLPGALCAWLVLSGLRARTGAGLAAAAAASALLAAGLVAYRRRGPDRRACAACPEAPPSARCSGFREVAARERAFRRLASRWLGAAGPGGLAPGG